MLFLLPPDLLFNHKAPLHPLRRDQRPHGRPPKRHSPPNNIRRIPRQRKYHRRRPRRNRQRTRRPKQRQPMQHAPKRLTRHIAQVKALAELGAARAVDAAHVFDEAVDAGAERSACGDGGDAYGRWDAEEAHGVDDEELEAEGEDHAWDWHREEADGGFMWDCADNEFDHYGDPGEGEVPVEPVELGVVS